MLLWHNPCTPACFQSTSGGRAFPTVSMMIISWLVLTSSKLYRLTGNKKYLKQSGRNMKFLLSNDVPQTEVSIGVEQKGIKEYSLQCNRIRTGTSTFWDHPSSAHIERTGAIYMDKSKLTVIWHLSITQTDECTGTEKYAYNTGQMLQAASLLYKPTG